MGRIGSYKAMIFILLFMFTMLVILFYVLVNGISQGRQAWSIPECYKPYISKEIDLFEKYAIINISVDDPRNVGRLRYEVKTLDGFLTSDSPFDGELRPKQTVEIMQNLEFCIVVEMTDGKISLPIAPIKYDELGMFFNTKKVVRVLSSFAKTYGQSTGLPVPVDSRIKKIYLFARSENETDKEWRWRQLSFQSFEEGLLVKIDDIMKMSSIELFCDPQLARRVLKLAAEEPYRPY